MVAEHNAWIHLSDSDIRCPTTHFSNDQKDIEKRAIAKARIHLIERTPYTF